MSREEFEAQESVVSPTEMIIQQPGGRVEAAVMTTESRERQEERQREQRERERMFVSTEYARIAGVDTSFYTPEYLQERRRQVQAFINNSAPMDGVEPDEVVSYAQLDLYQNRLNESYFRDFVNETDEVRSRETSRQIFNFIQGRAPVRGDLPGLYVIANRFPNRFMWNLLHLEGLIENVEDPRFNTIDKIINLTVKAENWQIVKRTLAGLRAERQRILRDETNSVEVRVGRLGRFMNALKRRFR